MTPAHRLAAHAGRRPQVVLAVKTAVAAGAAWLAVQPLGGVADDYPYYAPLGAVVAMSATVATSLRTSARAVVAIIIGAALALLVRPLPAPQVVGLMIVVGLGTLFAGWKHLGSRGTWVTWAALFVLVLGDDSPWHYVLGYAGLTAFGAVLGITVNLAADATAHAVGAWRAAGAPHAIETQRFPGDKAGASLSRERSLQSHDDVDAQPTSGRGGTTRVRSWLA